MCEVRDEVRAVTAGRVEELTKTNEAKYEILSVQLQNTMNKDLQRLKEGLE